MNASITFRLPALGRPCEDDKPPDVAGSSLPAASPSDEAVIEQICHGGAEALAVLFRRYARTIRGVAYKVLRDTAEADDLLQDIFLLVHRLCGTFDSSKGSARFWVLQMTYRRAISRRRYLTSRHFYTHLDLDQAADQIGDVSTRAGRPHDPMNGSP